MLFRSFFLFALACSMSPVAVQARGRPPWFVLYRKHMEAVRREMKATPALKTISSCTGLSAATKSMPSATYAATPLPPPSPGLSVYHVAIGRGTQNYTCTSPKNATATPTALGAIATLYNVSCQASISANTLAYVADTVAKISLDSFGPVLFPASPSSLISGYHYFADATTPTFNLNVDSTNLGVIFSEKKANVTAPTYAGTGADGSKAVPWLKLTAKKPPGTDSDIDPENVGGVQEVYRVNTAGGAAPATCAGIEGTTFTRQYSAEYWFWAR